MVLTNAREIDMDMTWTAAGCYLLAIVSAVLPWVNAEVLMLSAVPLAGTPLQLAALAAAVTAGQMTGKSAMYWVGKRSTDRGAAPRHPRLSQWLARWRRRLERGPASAVLVVFLSAVVGFPPFYLVSIAAGALGMAFGAFLAVGAMGRLIHFATVAFAARAALGAL